MNPVNLIRDINGYGYDYSIGRVFIGYIIAIIASLVTGFLYKLNLPQIMVICFAALLATPFLVTHTFKSAYQQKRFAEVNKYVEKMLYYFKSNKKILVSLKDIQRLFPKGEMAEVIKDAINHIENCNSQSDVTEEALKMIADRFPCERLRTMHGFLLSVERNGGDCDIPIDMLLKDRNLWADRVIDTQKRKTSVKSNILISVILSLVLCLSIIYLPSMVASNVNIPSIAEQPLVSWSATLLVCVLLFLYVKADGKMCVDWLDEDDSWDDEKAEREYDKVMEYNASAGMRESLFWALGALILTIVLMMFLKNVIVLIVGAGLVLFMLNQHTFGHNLAKKKVARAIEKAFPTWLMNVSLLLQSENVRVSIRESYHTAPSILKPALADFLEELDENPDSEVPFNEFLEYFDMPEITDAMSTLYSLSTGAGGSAETEFKNIINRILKMMDRAEQIKNDDKIAVMGIYVTAPSLIGALKLVIDMTALLFAFFAMA